MGSSYSTTTRGGSSIVAGSQRCTTQSETSTTGTQSWSTAVSLCSTGSGNTVPCPCTGTGSRPCYGRSTACSRNSSRIRGYGNSPVAPGSILFTTSRLGNRASCRLTAMSSSICYTTGRGCSIIGRCHCCSGTGEASTTTADRRSSLFSIGNSSIGQDITHCRVSQSRSTTCSSDCYRTRGNGYIPVTISKFSCRLSNSAGYLFIGLSLFKGENPRSAIIRICILRYSYFQR